MDVQKRIVACVKVFIFHQPDLNWCKRGKIVGWQVIEIRIYPTHFQYCKCDLVYSGKNFVQESMCFIVIDNCISSYEKLMFDGVNLPSDAVSFSLEAPNAGKTSSLANAHK